MCFKLYSRYVPSISITVHRNGIEQLKHILRHHQQEKLSRMWRRKIKEKQMKTLKACGALLFISIASATLLNQKALSLYDFIDIIVDNFYIAIISTKKRDWELLLNNYSCALYIYFVLYKHIL